MMASQYSAVNGGIKEADNWKPFLRQLHMSSGVWTLYFINGLSTGAPTVFVPQIRKDWNTTVTIDDDLASWLYSASNFAALPWIFILPVVSQLIGRKIPYLTCCIAISTVFTLLYFSSAPYHILIAEAIQGVVNASAICILIHIIPEYSNHRYRNMYLNIQCTSYYWGIWAANAIGTFLHWKYIPILGLVCALYTFTVSFYPESPRWLASKEKFTECEKAHRWLHGTGDEAEKELRDLLKSQTDYSEEEYKITVSKIVRTLTYRPFYMPLLLVILAGAQYNLSGKFVSSIYAIEVLKRVTKNDNAAYTGMLILDGVTVFGMYVGCFLSKILKLRPLLLTSSFISICVMFTFSLYLYLVNLEVIPGNNIITLGILVVYSLIISSGPTILCLAIHSEIISIRYQAVSYVIASFFFLSLCTVMLKFAPVFFTGLGIHGSFLFYGISSSIATVLLYVYLPETKNRTLEEIEQCFKEVEEIPEAEKLTNGIRNRKLSF